MRDPVQLTGKNDIYNKLVFSYYDAQKTINFVGLSLKIIRLGLHRLVNMTEKNEIKKRKRINNFSSKCNLNIN